MSSSGSSDYGSDDTAPADSRPIERVDRITLPSCNLQLNIFDYDDTCLVEAVVSNPDTASQHWLARHIPNVYNDQFVDPESRNSGILLPHESIRKTTDRPCIKTLYDWLSIQPVVESDNTKIRTFPYQDLPTMTNGGWREMVVRLVDASAKCMSNAPVAIDKMVAEMGAEDAGFDYTPDPWLTSMLNISVHDQSDRPVGPQFKIDGIPTLENSEFEP